MMNLRIKNRLCMIGLLSALTLVVGCSSAPVKKSGLEGDAQREYQQAKDQLEKSNVVSPGFTLRIRHGADENISGDFKVAFNGELKLPYKVTVEAAGVTTEEVAARVEKAYRSYFKIKNNVTVDIVKRQYLIEARGLIEKPGIYDIKVDTSLEEIISSAGGLPGGKAGETGSNIPNRPEWVRIVRPNYSAPNERPFVKWVRLTDYFLKYDVRNEILWRGGERLFFQISGDPDAAKGTASQTVQVLGEVMKPGEYPLQTGLDLYSYIAQAGGPTSSADLEQIMIVQRSRDSSQNVDLSDGTKTVELQAGDVILVKVISTRTPFLERVGPLLISLASLVVSSLLLVISL